MHRAGQARRVYRLQELVAHGSDVNCVHISRASGAFIVTGGDDCRVNLWALGKPHALAVSARVLLFTPCDAQASVCCFVPSLHRLLAAVQPRSRSLFSGRAPPEPFRALHASDLLYRGRSRRNSPRRGALKWGAETVGRASQHRRVSAYARLLTSAALRLTLRS